MATTTFTAELAKPGVQPKTLHTGANVVRTVFVGANVSLSDHILLCKIPNRATIVDCYGTSVTAQTTLTIDVGLEGIAQDNLIDGGTKGALAMGALRRVKVSLTDNHPTGFVFMSAVAVAGTFTISFSLDLTVEYVMDALDVE